MASPKLQFADALRHHRAGRLKQAEQSYRHVLRQQPCHAEALRKLGELAKQLGRQQIAIEHLHRALARKPNNAELLCQLGDAQLAAGNPQEARSCYEKACRPSPSKSTGQGHRAAMAQAQFRLGNLAKAAGRLDHAETHYRQALTHDSQLAKAAVNLGNVLLSLGRLDEAAQNYQRALAVDDRSPAAHNNLGHALQLQGELNKACACYQRALALRPEFHAAALNLGGALMKLGRANEARDCLEKLTGAAPQSAEAYNNLGRVLQQIHEFDRAERAYRRAAELKPDWAEPLSNLGTALKEQGRSADAIDVYREALRVDPTLAEAYNNLGNALKDECRLEEAEQCLFEAVRLRPDYGQAWNNLGVVHQWQGNVDEALRCYRRSLESQADNPDTLNNLGYAFFDRRQYEAAETALRRATQLDPEHTEAWNTLGRVYQVQGRLNEAAECFGRLAEMHPQQAIWRLRLASLCPVVFESTGTMDRYGAQLATKLDDIRREGIGLGADEVTACDVRPPFAMQFLPGNLRGLKEAYARLFLDSFAEEAAGEPVGRAATTPQGQGKIHVAWVVTKTHERSFVRSLAAVLRGMDPQRFALTIVCSAGRESLLREAFPQEHIRLMPIRPPLANMTLQLRDAQFDVLYYWEIGTDVVNYFLPFCRLAPVQCTSWGIQITSGIPQVDYYLSSRLVECGEAQEHYTERLLLADTLLSCQPRVPMQRDPEIRARLGFSTNDHLYCCVQQMGKFHPDFDRVIAEILRRDRQGKLVVAEDDSGLEAGRLKHRLASRFGDVCGRVAFIRPMPRKNYLELIEASEVAIDPIGFGGVNTTYDALSLNRPVVTLPTTYHRGRYTLGCYRRIGFTDLVVRDTAAYVDIAVALATQPGYRAEVVSRLERATPALFDDAAAIAEHERLFREMIEAVRARCPSGHYSRRPVADRTSPIRKQEE